MENTIFKKMRTRPGMSAAVLYAPEGYPAEESELQFDSSEKTDFVHLFVRSRTEFEERIPEALAKRADGALFWISYPKGSSRNKPDINRDILWDLSIPKGVHPVAQVSLDETWSAMRMMDNKPGEEYERPKRT